MDNRRYLFVESLEFVPSRRIAGQLHGLGEQARGTKSIWMSQGGGFSQVMHWLSH